MRVGRHAAAVWMAPTAPARPDARYTLWLVRRRGPLPRLARRSRVWLFEYVILDHPGRGSLSCDLYGVALALIALSYVFGCGRGSRRSPGAHHASA